MSTFNGIFADIPLISADRFQKHNLTSKLFFLSHCHADHMHGLSDTIKLPGPIYTSEISAIFLRKEFPNLKNIEILEIDNPIELNYCDDENNQFKLLVTAIPAQHCPGSVMFIFETEFTKILYTGDFRILKESITNNKFLMCSEFDKIYLDSTFLNNNYNEFPNQIKSINIICKLVKEWIENGNNYKVILELPAQYGYEYLLMELNRKLNKKLYIDDKQLEKYAYFPSMDLCFDQIENDNQIIVTQKYFGHNSKKTSLDLNKNTKYRLIKPTAIYWKNWQKGKPFYMHEGNQVYRVAYSNHSSLNEIKYFLDTVKGKYIELNVIPDNSNDKYEMKTLLNQIKSSAYSVEKIVTKKLEFNNIFQPTELLTTTYKEKQMLVLPPKRLKLK